MRDCSICGCYRYIILNITYTWLAPYDKGSIFNNLGRFAAAAGSFYSSELTKVFAKTYAAPLPYRYSAIAMCAIFSVGLVTVFFAPETKGQPLPEEDAGAK